MKIIFSLWAVFSWSPADSLSIVMADQGLLGVKFLFVLEFLGKLLLLFAGSAVISIMLKLDKTYDNLGDHKNG